MAVLVSKHSLIIIVVRWKLYS